MNIQFLALITAIFHLLGIASAVQAIVETQPPKGP